MANKPLTKEQKMDILSQAIDAGAHIDINFHPGLHDLAPVDELKTVFGAMQAESSARSYEQSRWLQFSNDNRMDFRGVIFLPQKQTAPEWQDTGDMEEGNA